MSSGMRSSGHFRFKRSAYWTSPVECKRYPSKLIPFDLFGFPPSKASLVDKIRQLLLHKLLNLRDGLFKARFGSASDVQIKGGILDPSDLVSLTERRLTHHSICHAFVWVV